MSGGQLLRCILCLVALAGLRPPSVTGQDSAKVTTAGDSLSVKFVEADLRAVIQALGRYLSKPVLTTSVPATRVTLETPAPVPRDAVPALLRGLVESQGLQLTEDSAFYRVAPKPPEIPPPAPSHSAQSAVQLFVVRLNTPGADVAATVNLLFGGSGEIRWEQWLVLRTLSDELRRQQVPPAGAGQPPATSTPAANRPCPGGHHCP